MRLADSKLRYGVIKIYPYMPRATAANAFAKA